MFQPTNGNSIESQPTKSAELIGHSDDMLSEILLNLPKKRLINFKLVSKQWLSLIVNPQFLTRYTVLHPPSLSGLLLVPKHQNDDDENRIEYISLIKDSHSNSAVIPFLNYRSINILQSCYGLLLTCHGRKNYVFNPTTGESELLPFCPNQISNKQGLEYVFPPTTSSYYSLAFDPIQLPHYKIICTKRTSDQCRIAIYSSKSKIWKLSSATEFPVPPDIDLANAFYCNGAVHWTKRTRNGLYFDVEKELLNYLPELPRKEQYTCEFYGHSKGNLYCVFTMEGLHYYELFEMDRDYSEWHLKTKIELDALAFNFPKMAREINYQNPHFRYQCHVLSVISSNNGKVLKIVMSIPGEVIVYNCKKKTSYKIYNSRLRSKDRKLWYGVYYAHEYFENLFPVSPVSMYPHSLGI